MNCSRCAGRGEVYKMGNGYSHVDCGGVLVKCPLCNGTKKEATREEKLKVIEDAQNKESIETKKSIDKSDEQKSTFKKGKGNDKKGGSKKVSAKD